MTRHLVLGAVLAFSAELLTAQQSLTIYSDGRILMRSTVPSRVPSGTSTHRVAAGFLDAGSVFSLDSAIAIMGASYDEAVNEANTLRRAIGRKLVFETYVQNGVMQTVEAEVLGVEPELFKLADGTLSFQRPGRARYPADLVLVAPTLSLSVRSTGERDGLRLGWFTDGGGWNANYAVVLGRGTARVSGQAEITSGRLSVEGAEVQVLAGEVGGAVPGVQALARQARVQEMAMAKMADQAASEQGIGESHLYTIPGRLTVKPGTSTVAALFDPASTTWNRRYVVRGQLPWHGPLPQYGEEEKPPVEVQYILKRALKTTFGDAPLPGGTWRLYEADAAGRPQLIGEASSGHTAAGQEVKLWAGNAFDLTAERIQTDYTTMREGNRTIANAAYRVTLSNAKDSVVTVEVLENRRGEWTLVESSLPGEKVSSTETRFRLQVPARGQASLTYRVRAVW